MRYFLHISFDGSDYSGWQKQKTTAKTVQEVLEKNLSQIFKKEIIVYGCGRTDAGVHASQYILHINLDGAPQFDLKFRLNKNLPEGIAVFEIIKVEENQNARYDAVARTYDYFFHLEKDPTLVRHSSFYEGLELDFDLMKQATALIAQTKDFKNVCKQPDAHENTICHINKCALFMNERKDRFRFTITSNRFLRGMVRLCIFFLLEVGAGRLSLQDFEHILNQEKDFKDLKPALPNGLFLSKVEYPFLKLRESSALIKMLKLELE